MPQITFNIKMPIFVMRQYVRHRTQSLNEVSARYTQLEDEFYIPEHFRVQDKVNKQASFEYVDDNCNKIARTKLLEQCQECYMLYTVMLKNGIAKEMARLILPVNIYTEIYCHWDLKNLLHFIALRDDPHAQWEHQQYGKAIKEFLKVLFPWTMEAYEKYKWVIVESIGDSFKGSL
jgi:thymidylate synthase (FAD)